MIWERAINKSAIDKRWIFVVGALLAAQASAQNGTLPRGKKQPDAKKIVVSPIQPVFHSRCLNYFLHRFQPSVVETSDGKSLYFISRLNGRKFVKTDYQLLRFDQGSNQLFVQSTLDGKRNAALIPVNLDFKEMLVVSFHTDDGCFDGKAEAVGVNLAGRERAISGPLGPNDYFLTYSMGVPAIADMTNHQILAIAVQSFQKRKILGFNANELPIFFDKSKNELHVIRSDSSGTAELVDVNTLNGSTIRQMKIDPRDRLIQNGSRYVMVQLREKQNQLSIRETPDWSFGSGRYKLSLPVEAPINEAYFALDQKSKTALVFCKNPLRGRRWNQTYVFDYKADKLLGSFELDHGLYIDSATFRLDGNAVFVIKSFDDQTLAGIRIFLFQTKKWQPIHLEIY